MTTTIYRIKTTDGTTTLAPVFDPHVAQQYSERGHRVTAQTTTLAR